jgi:hypothetical protein
MSLHAWGADSSSDALGSGVVLIPWRFATRSWVAFDDIENEELEAAFSRGEDRVDFGSGR